MEGEVIFSGRLAVSAASGIDIKKKVLCEGLPEGGELTGEGGSVHPGIQVYSCFFGVCGIVAAAAE